MFGELQLPTEVVSSEYLTIEGGKFSSSRGYVIYVRDLLARYQPDALRYFISVAGPETQDVDFTWPEFVRRTNDELVAGLGQPRQPGRLDDPQEPRASRPLAPSRTPTARCSRRRQAASAPSATCSRRHRQKQAVPEAMRVVGEANKYLSDQAPWKLRTSEPERFETVLHVAAQAVSDCRTLLSPFLPHSAQAVHEALGGSGTVSPMPRIDEVDDLDGGPGYPVLEGDYRLGETVPAWESVPVVPGTPVAAAEPDLPQARRLRRRGGAGAASRARGERAARCRPAARPRPSPCRTRRRQPHPPRPRPARRRDASRSATRWPRPPLWA